MLHVLTIQAIVFVNRRQSSDWWLVRDSGRTGWVPANFVEVVATPPTSSLNGFFSTITPSSIKATVTGAKSPGNVVKWASDSPVGLTRFGRTSTALSPVQDHHIEPEPMQTETSPLHMSPNATDSIIPVLRKVKREQLPQQQQHQRHVETGLRLELMVESPSPRPQTSLVDGNTDTTTTNPLGGATRKVGGAGGLKRITASKKLWAKAVNRTVTDFDCEDVLDLWKKFDSSTTNNTKLPRVQMHDFLLALGCDIDMEGLLCIENDVLGRAKSQTLGDVIGHLKKTQADLKFGDMLLVLGDERVKTLFVANAQSLCVQVRVLHHLFISALVDGDKSGNDTHLSEDSMSFVGKVLDLDTEEQQVLWRFVDERESLRVTFAEFLVGLSKYRRNVYGMALTSFDVLDLLCLGLTHDAVIEKVNEVAGKRYLQSMPLLERVGIKVLRSLRSQQQQDAGKTSRQDCGWQLLRSATDPAVFDKHTSKMLSIHRSLVLRCGLYGALSGAGAAVCEVAASYMFNTVGFACEDPTLECNIIMFWFVAFLGLGITSAFEIGGMCLDDLVSSMRIAESIGLRLVPLNKRRVELASSLARSAMELGNQESVMFGINAAEKSSTLRTILLLLLYKAKVGLTSFCMRIILKRILARSTARSVVPFVAVIATAFWNMMIGHTVMRNAKVSALGVPCCLEILDELLNTQKSRCPPPLHQSCWPWYSRKLSIVTRRTDSNACLFAGNSCNCSWHD